MSFNIVIIVFASIVTIVGMVLTYRLFALVIQKKKGAEPRGRGHRSAVSVSPTAWQDLSERAENLNRRLQNLEEILGNHEEVEEKEKEAVK